jgi:hypothetical protein
MPFVPVCTACAMACPACIRGWALVELRGERSAVPKTSQRVNQRPTCTNSTFSGQGLHVALLFPRE